MKTQEELNELKTEELSKVAGGNGNTHNLIWDDPRCQIVANVAFTLAEDIQNCKHLNQSDKDNVSSLCDKFRKCINTPEYFNVSEAMNVFAELNSVITNLYGSLSRDAMTTFRNFTDRFHDLF